MSVIGVPSTSRSSGSHRQFRQPLSNEAVEAAVPIEAPAGSLVIWHGDTWHGSYPRTRPDVRTGIAYGFALEYFHPHEPVTRDVTNEMIEEQGPRFATIAGRDVVTWGTEGRDYSKLLQRPFRYTQYT